ncbi:hypothetical protein ACFQ0M_15145 [Kitasatospora aburaviensis]
MNKSPARALVPAVAALLLGALIPGTAAAATPPSVWVESGYDHVFSSSPSRPGRPARSTSSPRATRPRPPRSPSAPAAGCPVCRSRPATSPAPAARPSPPRGSP